MSERDGGPAYPVPGLQNDEAFNGMSLRDYFAAQALQGSLSALSENSPHNPSWLAKWAYDMADAMLAERAK